MDYKPSLKGALLRHVTVLNLEGPIHISGMAEAKAAKFCKQVGFIKSYQKNKKIHPQKGRGYGQVTYLNS